MQDNKIIEIGRKTRKILKSNYTNYRMELKIEDFRDIEMGGFNYHFSKFFSNYHIQ